MSGLSASKPVSGTEKGLRKLQDRYGFEALQPLRRAGGVVTGVGAASLWASVVLSAESGLRAPGPAVPRLPHSPEEPQRPSPGTKMAAMPPGLQVLSHQHCQTLVCPKRSGMPEPIISGPQVPDGPYKERARSPGQVWRPSGLWHLNPRQATHTQQPSVSLANLNWSAAFITPRTCRH